MRDMKNQMKVSEWRDELAQMRTNKKLKLRRSED